ncbi:MAG: hypothetical protein JOY85_22660 [Acidobacteriaceae bacterium]|nr:hypothetical protein [Acidobacteriaceae bacterium]
MNKSTDSYLRELIEHFCRRDDLSTDDPYDIWKTTLGLRVKDLYNSHRRLGLLPAGTLALYDNFLNNSSRWLYRRQEYPIVRAFAALCLINLYSATHEEQLLKEARSHLNWLLIHSCTGYSGPCWGLGFTNAVSRNLVYSANIPFSTMTPYPLEAFIAYEKATESHEFDSAVQGIWQFFDRDIQVMEEDEEILATSYGPFQDRTVTNAISYTMYSYAVCLSYVSSYTDRIRTRIRKLYTYIRRHQQPDGSWLYAPQSGSFIDCFHSCIVLKNLIKTDAIIELPGSQSVIRAGYNYLLGTLLDKEHFLFRRFSVKNKPGLVKFDLYDNAEVLNLAFLLGDYQLAQKLLYSIRKHFCRGLNIYSQIDLTGALRNKNTLRWAAMPFLYAASNLL